ncbi:Mu transposase C-terminal domain-containing protein [Nitrosovibrio sp. Nv4]|uniref:Mu transposase C-terminal domain-containing protein n=1 Tax=Nitrosovibrio sp. Nv4 TaxID=1945880 RepID=UPI000BC7303C|nr:Mu transposase C-terminal domain-containing protein [Nitrosovibrio sp. Nv4]SOD42293.1 putative transposase [Nitrosovibrio sp. Nv4]
MSALKSHYSCAELAAMRLTGFPSTKKGWIELVSRQKWQKQERVGRGGGFEYQVPSKVLTRIKEEAVQALVKAVPIDQLQPDTDVAQLESVKPAELKDWQRKTAQARAAICAEVRRLAEVGGTERAIRSVLDLAARGSLAPHLQRLVPIANAKAGTDRALSRGTLYRWLNDAQGGWAELAPKSRESIEVPVWAPYLLKLYQQPQKPSLAYCIEQLPSILPSAITPPSYHAANRFLKKMSKVDVQRGRMGSREIKSIRPFVRRDTAQMWPTDAYTADGHTFDGEVAHPAHGKAFRPEITTVIDIATRRAVGWSAGLAESTWAVLDALRHACETGGIPSIFYVDNGSGYRNAAMSDAATGFMERLSITLTHSLPYNSQARGVIERAHQTIWVRGAKSLPTYMGAAMDRQAKQAAYKITRADIKTSGTSRLLMGWNDFTSWCQQQVDDYNGRPHRALLKVRDEGGKLRHQTPNEAWAQAIAEGWKSVPVLAHEAEDLFRPYKEAKVSRAEIRMFGNLYFHQDLDPYHGEMVRVGYDIHDASRVWVRDQEGRMICVAEFEANKRNYFPTSFLEQAAQKRAEGRIKRAQVKIEEAEAELNPPQMLEYQPAVELAPMRIEYPREEQERQSDKPGVEVAETAVASVVNLPKRRPMFSTDAAKYRWLMTNAEQINATDEGWLDWYRSTPEWEDIFSGTEDEEVTVR